MQLIVNEGELEGQYFYNSVGEYISLRGKASSDSLIFEGYDMSGSMVDRFTLNYSGGKLRGKWEKPDYSKALDFQALESSRSFPAKVESPKALDLLTGKLWYSPESYLVSHWMYFSKSGQYRRRTNDEPDLESFTGEWKLSDDQKKLTLKDIESEEEQVFWIEKLEEDQVLELMPEGISGGSIVYYFKGTPMTVD